MAGSSIRRSDRATKGQHLSRRSSEDLSTTKPTTPITKGKAKAIAKNKNKKKEQAEDEAEEDDDDEEVIRCVCGHNVDDVPNRKFIACDACEAWQHTVCMGMPSQEKDQPEHYYCEQCRPEDHQELLAAMAKGHNLWEDRLAASKGGKRKSIKPLVKTSRRSSSAADVEQPNHVADKIKPTDPVVSKVAGTKRRHVEDSPQINHAPEPSTDVTPARRASSGRAEKRRKSNAKSEHQPSPGSEIERVEPNTPVVASELPKERQSVAMALTKVITDGIRERSQNGQFAIPDGHTAETLGKQQASTLEEEMFKAHWTAASKDKYTNQFRQVYPNLKSNALLLDQVIQQTLAPAQLAVMSSQDMASEEMQKRDALMKQENDKQAVLTERNDDGPQLVKTSTGLEYVSSKKERDHEPGTNQAESSTTPVEVKPKVSVQQGDVPSDARNASVVPAARESAVVNSKDPTVGSPIAQTDDRRSSQQQFDINSVWAKTQHQSPVVEKSAAQRESLPPAKASTDSAQPPQRTEDPDVDRLLEDVDDDDDDEVYVPQDTIPSGQTVIWQGKLVQPGVAETTVTGRYLAGIDYSPYIPWQDFFPSVLEIDGRLAKAKADEYLLGLKHSRKSDVSVIALTPGADGESFDSIFEYFLSRGRYAACKRNHGIATAVTDLYLTPVEANAAPPPHINKMQVCTIDWPCPNRLLLATYVVNKPAEWIAGVPKMYNELPPAPSRQSLPGPIASPINSAYPNQQPSFPSSTPDQNMADRQGYHSGMPPNWAGAQVPPQVPQYDQYSGSRQQQQQQQQQQQHVSATSGGAAARFYSILGPYVMTSAIQKLLAEPKLDLDDGELYKIRFVLDKEPAARDDLALLDRRVQVLP